MLDYESIVIAVLYNCGGGMSIKRILSQTKLAKKHEEKLKAAAKKLIAEKVIFKNKYDRLYISEMRKVFTGRVASLAGTYGFITNTLTGEDCFVKGSALKGAIPGDIVLARELEEKSGARSAVAAVIAILEKTEELFAGSIVRDGEKFCVLPDTMCRQPLEICKVREQIHEGDKVLFSVRKRGKHHSEHLTDIEAVFGSCEKASVCTDAYLAQNGIATKFSEEAAKQARETEDKAGSAKSREKRLDLRDKPIFTIDGADTKDIDDAISIERIEKGYLLGVHIADVSHYVKGGSALDADAFARGTSIYIADRVIPMLPAEISNGVCSLNPEEDRLAFSCIMELSRKGAIKKYRFVKSIIRSRVKGVYDEVNRFFDNTANEALKEKYREVSDSFPIMKELADILARNRRLRGAPEIKSCESKLICDENGVCTDVKSRIQGISEGIIEEFMLAANNAAAHTAIKRGLPFVYRVHEKPSDDKLLRLREELAALGINPLGIKKQSEASVFADLLDRTANDPRAPIINDLVLRTMSKAKYSEKSIGHFGLVMAEYAHFTSPIRRYSDLAVHRILSDCVKKISKEKIEKKYAVFAAKAAAQATCTELSAVAAERQCEEYYAAEYMKKHIGEEYDGIISGVISGGLFVRLENTVEGRISTESLPTGSYEAVNGISLVRTDGSVKYTIGDRLRVRCAASCVNTGKIDFELISSQ